MKILYYFGDDGTYMTRWQLDHFIDELKHHEVEFEFFNPLVYSSIDEANEKLIERLRNLGDIDCFMNAGPSTILYCETMATLSKVDIPKLLICFDNLHAPYMHKDIMPYFDLVWLTSRENEEKIKSWGVNTIFLPYAANPYKFIVSDNNEDVQRVCFIGSPYGTRCVKFNQLVQNGIPCDVFCGGKSRKNTVTKEKNSFEDVIIKFKNYFGSSIGMRLFVSNMMSKVRKPQLDTGNEYLRLFNSLEFSEMTKKYHEYSLSLNITEVWNTLLLSNPIYKLHLRTFEIPMSGGIEFTTYNEEVANYFEEDKEMVFYRSEEEYIDKAHYYLDDKRKELRERIKVAARKRAEKDHTWWNRFSVVFDQLGIK